MTPQELQDRLKSFAYRTVTVTEHLPNQRISKVIEDQLLRASFSAAANYRAACKAMSRKAFISKISIAFEESDESQFWLECIADLKLLPVERMNPLLDEARELASILAASRKSAQTNSTRNS